MIKTIDNAIYVSLPNDKSHYVFICPFCNSKAILFCWNGYKNCSCGAKFSLWNNGKYELNAIKIKE